MIKAVFFDIDGTLLSHQSGGVPESARESLRQLKEAGIRIFAATGRHMLELARLPVQDLPFDGYVTSNGQICLDGSKTLLYDNPIHPEDTRKLAALFDRMAHPIMIIERNRMYINFINETVRMAQREISTPVPAVGTYTGNPVYQFVTYEGPECMEPLAKQLPNCKMCRWNPRAFDIIPREGGKTAGIRQILRYFNLSREEIMAFGDGENDIDMLGFAGTGVAMGNAGDAVKEHAAYVTAGIDQDGVRQALQFYGII